MKLLGRIFRHFSKKMRSRKVVLGIYTYQVRELENGRGFIALGEEVHRHPEFQMATLAVWPTIPNQDTHLGPRLELFTRRNPGAAIPSMAIRLQTELAAGKPGDFTTLCLKVLDFTKILFT